MGSFFAATARSYSQISANPISAHWADGHLNSPSNTVTLRRRGTFAGSNARAAKEGDNAASEKQDLAFTGRSCRSPPWRRRRPSRPARRRRSQSRHRGRPDPEPEIVAVPTARNTPLSRSRSMNWSRRGWSVGPSFMRLPRQCSAAAQGRSAQFCPRLGLAGSLGKPPDRGQRQRQGHHAGQGTVSAAEGEAGPRGGAGRSPHKEPAARGEARPGGSSWI